MKIYAGLIFALSVFAAANANAQFVPNQAIPYENQNARLCSKGRPESQIAGYVDAINELILQNRRPATERNYARALEMLTPLAQSGDICSMIRFGQVLNLNGQSAAAMEWYKKASDTGSAFAQFSYAAVIRKSPDGNCDEMRSLLRKSADQGYIHAMISLAQSYENDTLCLSHDTELAKHWYEKGAGLGSAVAQHNLGYLILTYGPNRDNAKAWAWMSLAQLQPIIRDHRVEYEPNFGDAYRRTLERRLGQAGKERGLIEARLICAQTTACARIEPQRLEEFLRGN